MTRKKDGRVFGFDYTLTDSKVLEALVESWPDSDVQNMAVNFIVMGKQIPSYLLKVALRKGLIHNVKK